MRYINNRVKQLRVIIQGELRQSSLRDLAKAIGVSYSTLSRFSNGKSISLENLLLIEKRVCELFI